MLQYIIEKKKNEYFRAVAQEAIRKIGYKEIIELVKT